MKKRIVAQAEMVFFILTLSSVHSDLLVSLEIVVPEIVKNHIARFM